MASQSPSEWIRVIPYLVKRRKDKTPQRTSLSRQVSNCMSHGQTHVNHPVWHVDVLVAAVAVESVTAVAHGKLGILPVIPYPIPFTDGCKNSNLTCPLVAGQTYHYLTVVPVPEDAPTVSQMNAECNVTCTWFIPKLCSRLKLQSTFSWRMRKRKTLFAFCFNYKLFSMHLHACHSTHCCFDLPIW